MSNTFAKELCNIPDTFATNGQLAYVSTDDAIVDLFFFSDRGNRQFIPTLKTVNIDHPLLPSFLLYLRDCRGGKGEYKLFFEAMAYLKTANNNLYSKIVKSGKLEELGRFYDYVELNEVDPILPLFGSPSTSLLLYKWLPTQTTKIKRDRVFLKSLLIKLGYLTNKASINKAYAIYRKIVSEKRKQLNLLETNMTQGTYTKVDFTKTPTKALYKHTKAFVRHVPKRWEAYKESLKKDPSKARTNIDVMGLCQLASEDPGLADTVSTGLIEKLVKTNSKTLFCADISGSMETTLQGGVTALEVSTALAYLGSKVLTGPYVNVMCLFSEHGTFRDVGTKTFSQAISLSNRHSHCNTNVWSVFSTVLRKAIEYSSGDIKQAKAILPEKIVIVSDMQFDDSGTANSTKKTILKKYAEYGLPVPALVFWNLTSKNTPATVNDANVFFLSGVSQSNFDILKYNTMADYVTATLSNPRYKL